MTMKRVARFAQVVGVFVAALVAGCSADVIDTSEVGADLEALAASADCSLVRCALPECGDGQQLSYRGGCCPVCVGAPSRCADVLCPAVECPEGQQRITSPGSCCGRCVPARPVATCETDADCPDYQCFACPCPVSSCRGRECVTSTPDASTCGDTL